MYLRWRTIFLDVVIGVALFLAIDFGFTRSDFACRVVPDVFRIPDRALHHALRPNVSAALAQWGTERYPYSTNSLGLRDASPRTISPVTDARARVLILGDSITEGMGLPWNETFVGRVANELDDIEVLNGALTAYGPSLYLNQIKRLLAQGIRIDHVVFYVDVSNIQDEAALYRFDQDGNVIDAKWSVDTGAHVGDPPERIQKERTLALALARKLRIGVLPYFALTKYAVENLDTGMVRRLLNAGLAAPAQAAEADSALRLVRSMWTVEDQPAGYGDLGVAGGIDKARNLMTRAADLLRPNHIAFSVAVYPWPDQMQYDTVDSRAVHIWRDWCAQHGCKSFIDHFPDFFARKAGGNWRDELYLPVDFHFTPAGHRLIADRLARALRQVVGTGD